MMEEWKWIPGFEGCYKVSSLGRIFSVDRTVLRKRHEKEIPVVRSGQEIRTWFDKDGYKRVALSKDGSYTRHAVHIFVLLAFVGQCPDGKEARHLDNNRANNELGNLCWGTIQENKADRIRHDTWHYKLSRQKVSEIRRRKLFGEKNVALAREFGVTPHHIWYLCRDICKPRKKLAG